MLEMERSVLSIGSASAGEWKHGWPIVLTSAMGISFLSVVMGSLGTFIEPLTKEFGWSRASDRDRQIHTGTVKSSTRRYMLSS